MNDSQPGMHKAKQRHDYRYRVQRHAPTQLLRRPVELPGGIRVSAERHKKGRIMVRIESPEDEPLVISGMEPVTDAERYVPAHGRMHFPPKPKSIQ
jgi:hypothetical protein